MSRSAVDAEADAIIQRLAQKKLKPCIVGRHPKAALIDALLARHVADHAIEQEVAGAPSDSSIRQHREGTCSCPKP